MKFKFMGVILVTTILFCGYLLFGCGGGDSNANETFVDYNLQIDGNSIGFQTISSSEYTGFSDRITKRLEVINNQNYFEEAYFSTDKDAQDPAPVIAFEKYLVIAIAMGEQNTGGYSIGVCSVIEADNYVQVNVESSLPGEGCPVDMSITYPYSFVVIPIVKKEIIFSDTVSVRICP